MRLRACNWPGGQVKTSTGVAARVVGITGLARPILDWFTRPSELFRRDGTDCMRFRRLGWAGRRRAAGRSRARQASSHPDRRSHHYRRLTSLSALPLPLTQPGRLVQWC